MSESYEAPAADEQAPFAVDDERTGPDRRLVFGGLGAVVLAAGAFFFLTGGDDEAFAPIARAPRPAAPAAAAPAPQVKVPVKYAEQLGRDPFKALYVQTVAQAPPTVDLTTGGAGAPAVPAPPVTGTQPGAGAQPGTGTQPGTGGQPGTGAQPTAPKPAESAKPAPASQQTLRLLSVDYVDGKKVATFLIDGKSRITATQGSTILEKVQVVLLRPDREPGTWFATLKVGDGSQFDAHYGQTVVIPS